MIIILFKIIYITNFLIPIDKIICLYDTSYFTQERYACVAFILRQFHSCCSGWSAMVQFGLNTTSASWVQAVLLPQSPQQLALQACATTPGNFVFLVEMGFLHVGEAGLELPTSDDPIHFEFNFFPSDIKQLNTANIYQSEGFC